MNDLVSNELIASIVGALISGGMTIGGDYWSIRSGILLEWAKKSADQKTFRQASKDWFFNAYAIRSLNAYQTCINLEQIKPELKSPLKSHGLLLEICENLKDNIVSFQSSESQVSIFKPETMHEYASLDEIMKDSLLELSLAQINSTNTIIRISESLQKYIENLSSGQNNDETEFLQIYDELPVFISDIQESIYEIFDVYASIMISLNGVRFFDSLQLVSLKENMENFSQEDSPEESPSMNLMKGENVQLLKKIFGRQSKPVADIQQKKLDFSKNNAVQERIRKRIEERDNRRDARRRLRYHA